ncbi:hypothetical protein GCM10010169_48720 [Micromonospora fulviviridis]|nr:hypothetical protein GCM10010169_48720 [Micromonospora fulviviridis]
MACPYKVRAANSGPDSSPLTQGVKVRLRWRVLASGPALRRAGPPRWLRATDGRLSQI